jgi:hypothetical protein
MKIDKETVETEKEESLHLKRKKKRERFIRLSELRTDSILKQIDILTNCANRDAYIYTQEEVEQIFRAINEALAKSRRAFMSKGEKFKLSIDERQN